MDKWGEQFLTHPDRSTVYNWLNGTSFPKNMTRVLELSFLLNVDPVVLFDFTIKPMSFELDGMLRSLLSNLPKKGFDTSEILNMFGPRVDWPSNSLIFSSLNKKWNIREFEHNGGTKNFYQTIEIDCKGKSFSKTFHIAYRGNNTSLWRVFGHFTVFSNKVETNNYFQGKMESARSVNDPIRFSTYFGEGTVLFRLASLKAFTTQFSDKHESNVRFLA